MGWTIKQAAEKTGIPAETLRYYDKIGIISPKRNGNRYRQYDDNDLANLKNIVVMKYAQFSLAEIKDMEELFNSRPNAGCSEISKEILNSKVTELRQVICNYQNIVKLMEDLLQMVDNNEAYQTNDRTIDDFISQIFNDIRSGGLASDRSYTFSNRNGGR